MLFFNQCLLLYSIIQFSHLFNISSSSLIQIRYFNNYFSNNIEANFGLNIYSEYFTLDLTSEYSRVVFSFLPGLNPSTLIIDDNFTSNTDTEEYSGKLIEETIFIETGNPVRLQYNLLVRKKPSSFSLFGNAIGLAFTFTNNKTSLIHQYKQQGLIDHLSFAITDKFNICLGGIPIEETTDRFYSFCNVIGVNSSWNCPISEVIFNNGIKEIHHPLIDASLVKFTTYKRLHYVPKAFFDLLCNEIYEINNRNSEYHLLSIYKNKRSIITYNEWNTKKGNITFVIEDYAYTIDLIKLWDCGERGCELILYLNPYGDYWVLGSEFYSNMNVHFDYEKGMMHFYSRPEKHNVRLYDNINKDKITIKGKVISNRSINIILYCTSTIEIIGMIMLLVIMVKYKQIK